MDKKSLFVVSLPRSLSTTLYHAASRSLRLREPGWTSGGEILNRDRVRSRRRRTRASHARFTVRESEPDLFAQIGAALAGSVEARGFAYKDVVQPFVVADWLDPAQFCVLKIRRDVAEVAYSMLKRHWHYPASAASVERGHPLALIEGLLRAERALAELPGETVHYGEALESHEPLAGALRALYPGDALSPVGYIDRRFVRTRTRLEERRRDSALFHELREAVARVRASLEGQPPPRPVEHAALERLDPLSVAAST